MKQVSLVLSAAIFVLLIACSSLKTKNITPTTREFLSGGLGEYVEVVDQPSELSFIEKERENPIQCLDLKVTLKLVNDDLSEFDAKDIDFTNVHSVAMVNLVDERGDRVQVLTLKHEDLLKLKRFLTGKEGATEEFVFEGEFNNPNDAPQWFKETVQFTPYITGDIYVNAPNIDDLNVLDSDLDVDSVELLNSSEDLDVLLDAYEESVDSYLSLLEDTNPGDLNTLAEYAELVKKALYLQEKISEASIDLTAAQLSRLNRIKQKMESTQ